MNGAPDVVVMGEALVELASAVPLRRGAHLRLGFSGDALNTAAAAAAVGAHVVLVCRIGADELGRELVAFAESVGIDTSYMRAVDAPNGMYFLAADPSGEREFVYARRGSAGSSLDVTDAALAPIAGAGALVVSGITQALSSSACAAVEHAARRAAAEGTAVVYDPNVRLRLTEAGRAREALASVAPYATIVTPSCPNDTRVLLGTNDPRDAAARIRAFGANAVAVTCGADGAVVDDGRAVTRLAPTTPPRMIDTTGAGDVFAGTLAALLAGGEPIVQAARVASAAASLSLGLLGGAGGLAPLDAVRAHLAAHAG